MPDAAGPADPASSSISSPRSQWLQWLFTLAFDLALSAALALLVARYALGAPLQGAAASLAQPAVYGACCVGGGALLLLRLLPEFGARQLLAAEARILADVPGVAHDWAAFSTAGGVQWRVHSLHVRGRWAGGSGSKSPRAAPSAGSGGGGGDGSGAGATGAGCAAAPLPLPPLPTVVVLHGHSCGAAHWEVMLRELGQHTDVWVLDIPGWGRSPAPPQLLAAPRQPSCATRIVGLHNDMLEGWLRSKGLGCWEAPAAAGSSSSSSSSSDAAAQAQQRPVVLLGHSMGGHICASFCAAHPRAVAKLLLASPVGYLPMQPGGRTWRSSAVFFCFPPQRGIRLLGRCFAAGVTALMRAVYPEDNPLFVPYYMQLAWATWHTGACDAVYSNLFQARPGGRAMWTRPWLPLLLEREQEGGGGGEGEGGEGQGEGQGARAAPAPPPQLRTPPLALLWGTAEELMLPVWASLIHRLRPATDLYLLRHGKHNTAHSHPHIFVAAALHAVRRAAVGAGAGGEGGSARRRGSGSGSGAAKAARGAGDSEAAALPLFTDMSCLAGLAEAAALGTADAIVRLAVGEAGGSGSPVAAGAGGAGAGAASSSSSGSSSSDGGAGGGVVVEVASARGRRASASASASGAPRSRARSASPASSPRVSAAAATAPAAGTAAAPGSAPAAPPPPPPALSPAAATAIGRCAHCRARVAFSKSYWHCRCGAWSYTNSFVSDPLGWRECAHMLGFLDELYLAHPVPFNAATSVHVRGQHRVVPRGGAGAGAGAGVGAGGRSSSVGVVRGKVAAFTPALMPGATPRGKVFLLG